MAAKLSFGLQLILFSVFWSKVQLFLTKHSTLWPNIKERRKHKLKENEVDKIVNTLILSVLNITPNIHTQGFVFVIGNWNGVGGGGGELVKWYRPCARTSQYSTL